MDKNNFDQLGFPVNDGDSDDFGATRELNSIHDADPQDDPSGIAPRERFTELNSADDPGSTRMMDSLSLPDEPETPAQTASASAQNPVKKRRKRRKKKHRSNHTRTMGHVFLGVVLSVAAICAGIFLAWKVIIGLMDYTGMAKSSHEADIVIDGSMNVDDIADTLHENGIIEMPWLFKTYINMTGKDKGFLDGEYTVNSTMSYSNIITLLKTVRQYTNTVTIMIPEGYNAMQIGELLEENLVCRADDFEKYYRSKLEKYDFEEKITVSEDRFYALEGYLFPDTYEFYVIDDLPEKPNMDTSQYAKQAAEKMYSNFESKITNSMYARAKELGMTFDQVITLASIIQKEGTNEENMANISSVFHNRLENMYEYPHLQSDTTDHYIEDVIRPNIPSSSLALYENVINAYDTYTCEGLPAGPICSPGMEAINAALYPAETDYYYFLSSSDGIFYYASTVEKHEQNIVDAALREEEQN
ncbi:MAG: endolytic transglycosylase MltG [Oscillospiraceae bacterium]|nr:endolytic transglycosylase MltG [Oscillospiraceae bacterium]